MKSIQKLPRRLKKQLKKQISKKMKTSIDKIRIYSVVIINIIGKKIYTKYLRFDVVK